MKRFLMGVVSTVLLLTSGCSNSVSDMEQLSDRMFSQLNNDIHKPSACVLVIKDGRKIFEKTYGSRDITTGEPATVHTGYRMACITKTMTSMCIMMLKEQNLLDFDQRVNTILTDIPKEWESVTIRHLLTNASGISPFYGKYWPPNSPQMTDLDAYNTIKAHPTLNFEPGTRIVDDSDTNFVILGMVIEKLSGMKYQDFVQRRIFDPLGMEDSVVLVEGSNCVPERSYGTCFEDGKYIVADQSITSAVLSDGGVYSSLHDLYLYDQELNQCDLVSKATVEEAMSTGPSASLGMDSYACGWWKLSLDGHREVRMGGWTKGFLTGIERLPDDNVTVIVLTNIDGKKDIRGLQQKLALMAVKKQ